MFHSQGKAPCTISPTSLCLFYYIYLSTYNLNYLWAWTIFRASQRPCLLLLWREKNFRHTQVPLTHDLIALSLLLRWDHILAPTDVVVSPRLSAIGLRLSLSVLLTSCQYWCTMLLLIKSRNSLQAMLSPSLFFYCSCSSSQYTFVQL